MVQNDVCHVSGPQPTNHYRPDQRVETSDERLYINCKHASSSILCNPNPRTTPTPTPIPLSLSLSLSNSGILKTMALQLWEAVKESITAYTGLSPVAFFTAIAVGLAFYQLLSTFLGSDDAHVTHASRRSEEEVKPLPPPVQLGEVTVEELKQYDGTDTSKPLLMAVKGQIYDVSQSRMFYGPGGPYALFAGKDASRALAKMSFDEKDLNGDLTGLGVFELDALRDWEYNFSGKYVKVGTVKATAAAAAAKSAEDGPSVEITDAVDDLKRD